MLRAVHFVYLYLVTCNDAWWTHLYTTLYFWCVRISRAKDIILPCSRWSNFEKCDRSVSALLGAGRVTVKDYGQHEFSIGILIGSLRAGSFLHLIYRRLFKSMRPINSIHGKKIMWASQIILEDEVIRYSLKHVLEIHVDLSKCLHSKALFNTLITHCLILLYFLISTFLSVVLSLRLLCSLYCDNFYTVSSCFIAQPILYLVGYCLTCGYEICIRFKATPFILMYHAF